MNGPSRRRSPEDSSAGRPERQRTPAGRHVVAAALDLGTTRIKGGLLGEDGNLHDIVARPAPPLRGEGLVREADPEAYLHEAGDLLAALARAAAGRAVPLGIASQRSTFVLWESAGGDPVTPLVSWQDRRAESWCARHSGIRDTVGRITGLRLSPHYAGPKLAAFLESDASLRRGMERGEIRFGTLESFLAARLAGGRTHETDLSMAARTLLADPRRGAWSEELLELFGVPGRALASIVASSGARSLTISGMPLAATLADQSAALLAVVGESGSGALVSLGTGGFVLRPVEAGGGRMDIPPGHLASVVLGRGAEPPTFAAEGTINGVAEALAAFGVGPTELPEADPAPEAWCLPDMAGTGSPHWRTTGALELSPGAEALDGAGRRRTVLEGIVFRIREILEEIFRPEMPGRIFLAGGAAAEPGLAEGLAACLHRPVERLADPEATLLGAARLAAGLPPAEPAPRTTIVPPGSAGRYLAGKFEAWRGWVATLG